MLLNPKELSDQTDARRRDFSFLEQFGVDASQVRTRSKVYQREFIEDGVVVPVYVKVYTYKKHRLQRLWRTGTSRTEARNLLFFSAIGIAAPRVVAWGAHKNAIGKIIEEFIITEAISDTQTLREFMETACPDRSRPAYCQRRDSIVDQLGRWSSEMHAHNFCHQDLKWRNILARMNGEAVELFWIDCPKGDFNSLRFRQKRGQLKDCATLDKLARLLCTEEERLRFVAAYLKKPVDAPEVEAFSTAISRYRRTRFDPQDDRQLADAAKQK